MAYQSKKHRKFVAAAATATLVASAVAPAALAAETAATKDFSDVANHWGKEAIDYLVNKGVLDGYPNGTFQPDGDITRAEVAKVLAVTLELDVDMDAKASFADADDHWASAYIAAIEGQLEGVINGFEDGTFRPDQNISRQDMAKMIVAAYGLEGNADVDVEFNDKASYAEAQEAIEILASLGVVQGQSEGVFAPAAEVTRAETATFVMRSEVPSKRVIPTQVELMITNVSALTDDGHVLKVEFSRPMDSFDKYDVTLQEKASKSRVGIETVELSKDGMTAEIVTYDNTSDDAPEEVKRGVEYSLTINTLAFDFTRPYFLDDRNDARVTEIDAEDKDFTVSYVYSGDEREVTIDVPEGVEFDYEYAVGMEIRVWYDGDNNLVDYEIVDESKVLFDAFEVSDVNEIELQTADKEYDLATDKDDDATTVYYLDGKKADIEDLADAEYAKIILDDKGDVAYIYAYNFEGLTVVEEVDGTIVEGLGDEDLDLEDFVIVKEGKTIQISDLEEGDAIHYTEGADNSLGEKGYAVVYNNIITGEIETIYDDSLVVDGKKYSYDTISFLNEDNEIETSFDKDDAEDFEVDEVTIYVDYNGDIQLLTGVQGDVGNDVGVILTDKALVWEDNKNNVALELEYVTEEGEEDSVDVSFDDLDSITVDGFKYKIEQDKTEGKDYIVKRVDEETFTINVNNGGSNDDVKETLTLDDNTPIFITLDEDGNITDLEIFDTLTNGSADLKEDIEPGDNYAELTQGDKRLQNNTLIFVTEDGADTDAEDVEVYRFADIDFDIDKADAEVYYNEDGDVEFIVVNDTVAANTTDVIGVVDSYSTSDDDVTRIVAWVNGKKVTYTVDKVELTDPTGAKSVKEYLKTVLADGKVVMLEVNNDNGEVEDIFLPGDEDNFDDNYIKYNQTGATSITSSKFTLDGDEYRKGDNFQIIDATDTSDLDTETSLNAIKGKKFHVILEASGSRYVDTIVIVGDEGDSNGDGEEVTTEGTVTYINAARIDVKVDGKTTRYDLSETSILRALDGNTYVGGTQIVLNLNEDDLVKVTDEKDGVVLELVQLKSDSQKVTDAGTAVTALETAAGLDLTVEANLTDAEAKLADAQKAVAALAAGTDKTALEAKVATAKTTVEAARVTFIETTATTKVGDLETAVGLDLTVEANLTAAKNAIKPAEDAVALVKDATKKTTLQNRIAVAKVTIATADVTAIETTATTKVGDLETAVGLDLTVEANLTAAEAAIKPAKDAVALVNDAVKKATLNAKILAAETTIDASRVAFDVAAAEKAVGDATTTLQMKKALEDNAKVLGLSLTGKYVGNENAVAEEMVTKKPFANKAAIKAAFDAVIAGL